MAISKTIRRYAGLPTDDPRFDVLETDSALWDELDEIERRRKAAGFHYDEADAQSNETLAERTKRLKLTALCLSGGGIRSASFCLGGLQSLAKMGLLNEFDYLSTVSGGGFIGGWVQTLIKESGNVTAAQTQLASNRGPALQRLRAFTNYLTPRTGPFSADVWAGIVLYLRNLILNWMVFTPLFLLVALAPIAYRTLITVFHDPAACDSFWPIVFLTAVATGALGIGTWQACALLPSHRTASHGFARREAVTTRILVPSLTWAFVAPALVTSETMPHWIICATYAAALLAGYAVAWFAHGDHSAAGRALYRSNLSRWAIATACSTGLLGLAIVLIQPGSMLYALATLHLPTQDHPWLVDRATALGTFGPLWFVGTHLFHTTFYVGFRREALHADLDREWLARLSGEALLVGAVWTMFAFSCLVLPTLLTFVTAKDGWSALKVASAGAGSSIAGAIGAWLGKKLSSQLETAAVPGKVWTRAVPNALAAVFAVGVFVCASSVLQPLLGQIATGLHDGVLVSWTLPVTAASKSTPWHVEIVTQILCAAVLAALVVCFGGVNVNRYSMHAIYRNRLARAFLGSARQQRDPDPFTGFDDADNPAFGDYLAPGSAQRLFPVVNMTLNVTSSENAAWAERKAASFSATPLMVGAAMLRHPAQRPNDGEPLGAFVPTRHYAGKESRWDIRGTDIGPRLGSLLTISGAAVSPNWGYHSSPLTAFVMTLFNVRLGAWLPNPAVATADELRLAKPKNSVTALLSELAGVTTDTSQAIYLSDGGHFENLGMYEMLRRRCERIVVIDAGQDGDCNFFDLGNAIRKARIDLNAEVKMPDIRIVSRKTLQEDKTASATALAIAVGSVTYEDGGQGTILYLKPSFLDHIPADVLAYGRSDTSFPHDSTAEQWFTESQFESYRALGRWQFEQLDASSLASLFGTAQVAVARVGKSTRPDPKQPKRRLYV